jgi:hypothetical protein
MSPPEVPKVLFAAVLALFVIGYAFVSWAAFRSFRTTAAGLLIGGSFALQATRAVILLLADHVIWKDASLDHGARLVTELVVRFVGIFCDLAGLVGLALIPLSRDRLARERGSPGGGA